MIVELFQQWRVTDGGLADMIHRVMKLCR